MRDFVAEWVQEGRLCVWRYADAGRHWRGWQFSADPAACRSVRNLLDRMFGGKACHRTLKLEPVTDAVLRTPGYGHKPLGAFGKLRVAYVPGSVDLGIEPVDDMLVMTVGGGRLRKLSAAFAEFEAGHDDFGIAPSDNRKIEPWMFWWMPGAIIKDE